MKRKFYTLPVMMMLLLPLLSAAQQLKLGNSPATISKAAVLELESNKQGLLLTRITDTTSAPLNTAPDGTLLFFKGDNSLRIRSGNNWKKLITAIDTNDIASFSGKVRGLFSGTGSITYNSATGAFSLGGGTGGFWLLGGNNVSGLQTIGTTSNYDLPFITNNAERMRISTAGNVGIGASSFNNGNPERLLIDAGNSTSYNLVYAKGSVNNYLQFNIQNHHGGQSASSDIVATANNGSETTNFINMGINSGGYANTSLIGGTNTAYLYSTGTTLAIGNASANHNLVFFNGGVAAANEAIRVDASGNVGIANTNPQAKLDVGGAVKLGTAGTVITNMIKTSFNISDNTNIGYASPLTRIVAVAGAQPNASVIINPRSALPAGVGIAYAFVSSAGNITIHFTNTGAGLLGLQKLGSVTFDVTIINI